jgi:hypothetical protein
MTEGFGLGAATIAFIAVVLWTLARNKALYRKELPRIYELRDLLPNPFPSGAYFHNLDKSLAEWPQKRKQFRDIESDLQGLDWEAWAYLKTAVAPLLTVKHVTRGWHQLFDILNQAKAFNYLTRLGCTNVKFIPVSIVEGRQTPDLGADLETRKVLCEVKTINVSEIEACRRHNHGVGTSTDQLDDGFFRKLASDLAHATKQMVAYDGDSSTRRIAYVIVNFDDSLHEYGDRYRSRIDQFITLNVAPELEVVFDIKPPFGSALC